MAQDRIIFFSRAYFGSLYVVSQYRQNYISYPILRSPHFNILKFSMVKLLFVLCICINVLCYVKCSSLFLLNISILILLLPFLQKGHGSSYVRECEFKASK